MSSRCHLCQDEANRERAWVASRQKKTKAPRQRRAGASPAPVKRIRERAAEGVSQKDLAREYGVSSYTVSELVRGLTHKTCGGPIRGWDYVGAVMRRSCRRRCRDCFVQGDWQQAHDGNARQEADAKGCFDSWDGL